MINCCINQLSYPPAVTLTNCCIDQLSHLATVPSTNFFINQLLHRPTLTLTNCHINQLLHFTNFHLRISIEHPLAYRIKTAWALGESERKKIRNKTEFSKLFLRGKRMKKVLKFTDYDIFFSFSQILAFPFFRCLSDAANFNICFSAVS